MYLCIFCVLLFSLEQANLQRLIEVKPSLLQLGEKGIRLLSRYGQNSGSIDSVVWTAVHYVINIMRRSLCTHKADFYTVAR